MFHKIKKTQIKYNEMDIFNLFFNFVEHSIKSHRIYLSVYSTQVSVDISAVEFPWVFYFHDIGYQFNKNTMIVESLKKSQ